MLAQVAGGSHPGRERSFTIAPAATSARGVGTGTAGAPHIDMKTMANTNTGEDDLVTYTERADGAYRTTEGQAAHEQHLREQAERFLRAEGLS